MFYRDRNVTCLKKIRERYCIHVRYYSPILSNFKEKHSSLTNFKWSWYMRLNLILLLSKIVSKKFIVSTQMVNNYWATKDISHKSHIRAKDLKVSKKKKSM